MLKILIISFISLFINNPDFIPTNESISFVKDGSFFIITKDSLYKSKDGKNWDNYKLNHNIENFDKKVLITKNRIFFISNGIGKVHELLMTKNINSKETYLIERLDSSYDWKSHFNPLIFCYNKEIYSYGGYGFYSYKKELIKFNFIDREWDLVKLNDNSNIPIGRMEIIGEININKKTNNNTILIGLGINKHIDDQFYLNDVWEYNIDLRKWKLKGIIQNPPQMEKLRRPFKANPTKYKYKYKGKTQNAQLLYSNDKLKGYDLLNNIKINYPDFNKELMKKIKKITYNEKAESFLIEEAWTLNENKLIVVDKIELLGKPIFNELYISKGINKNYYLIYFIIAIIIISISIIILKLNKKKVDVFNKYLSEIKKELSDEELKIINTLITNHPNNTSFPEILNFYEQNLSYESRIKKLRLSLSNIDYIIKTQTKNKNYLNYSKNKNDKRIKQVKIHF